MNSRRPPCSTQIAALQHATHARLSTARRTPTCQQSHVQLMHGSTYRTQQHVHTACHHKLGRTWLPGCASSKQQLAELITGQEAVPACQQSKQCVNTLLLQVFIPKHCSNAVASVHAAAAASNTSGMQQKIDRVSEAQVCPELILKTPLYGRPLCRNFRVALASERDRSYPLHMVLRHHPFS